jgi:hypothetical protein
VSNSKPPNLTAPWRAGYIEVSGQRVGFYRNYDVKTSAISRFVSCAFSDAYKTSGIYENFRFY